MSILARLPGMIFLLGGTIGFVLLNRDEGSHLFVLAAGALIVSALAAFILWRRGMFSKPTRPRRLAPVPTAGLVGFGILMHRYASTEVNLAIMATLAGFLVVVLAVYRVDDPDA